MERSTMPPARSTRRRRATVGFDAGEPLPSVPITLRRRGGLRRDITCRRPGQPVSWSVWSANRECEHVVRELIERGVHEAAHRHHADSISQPLDTLVVIRRGFHDLLDGSR